MNFDNLEAKFKDIDEKLNFKIRLTNKSLEADLNKIESFWADNLTRFELSLNSYREKLLNDLLDTRNSQLETISQYFSNQNYACSQQDVLDRGDQIKANFKYLSRKRFALLNFHKYETNFSLEKSLKYSNLYQKTGLDRNLNDGFRIKQFNNKITYNLFLNLAPNRKFVFAQKEHAGQKYHKLLIVDNRGEIVHSKNIETNLVELNNRFQVAPTRRIIRLAVLFNRKEYVSTIEIYDYELNLVFSFIEPNKFMYLGDILVYENKIATKSFADNILIIDTISYEVNYLDYQSRDEALPFYLNDVKDYFVNFYRNRLYFVELKKDHNGSRNLYIINTKDGKRTGKMVEIWAFNNENLNSLLKFDTECKIYIYENRNKSIKVHGPDGEALFNINADGIGYFEMFKSLTFTLNKTVVFDIRIYNDYIEYNEN